jgi:hypothetical protein
MQCRLIFYRLLFSYCLLPSYQCLPKSSCALGAAFEPRYHPSFVTFPRSLADFFADRAKTLIEIELDCPSVATVQAMVVISGHDIGCKRDARGWLYSGLCLSKLYVD